MKILFLPKHEYIGASSRYRTLQYLSYIKEQNIDFDVSPLFSDEYLKYKYKYGKENKIITLKRILIRIKTILFDASKYDVFVIEKELIPYTPPILEWYLKFREIPYIVDYDDAVWHNYDLHRKSIVRFLFKNKISTVMKYATSIIAGSEYIKDYALNFNKDVYKIPTVIDVNKYQCVEANNKSDEFIVGWIGSPSSSQYILSIANALSEFAKEYNAIVHLVGFYEELASQLNFNNKVIRWSEESEIEEICKFNIGIMPLTDTAFERGKCGFKLIQYMGCKKPVIASAVGENKMIVENNINGFLANSNKEFLDNLIYFYNNRVSSIRFGINGFKKVEKLYSLEINKKKYLEVIERSVGL